MQNEFQILHHHVTGLESSDANLKLYENGIENLKLQLPYLDKEILKFLIKYPKSCFIVNFGLQVFLKKSILRKRFLLAVSIIECDKNYVHLFLNQKQEKMVLFKIIFSGIRAVWLGIVSFLLFKYKQWI